MTREELQFIFETLQQDGKYGIQHFEVHSDLNTTLLHEYDEDFGDKFILDIQYNNETDTFFVNNEKWRERGYVDRILNYLNKVK